MKHPTAMKKPIRWTLCLGLASCSASGQETSGRTLDELLNTQVEIATKRPQRLDEAPSIVSVVTRADIERYGWRELGEILRSLPGFDFGNDGTKLIGLAERGIWAHEGKALLLINGQTVSPLHNGNTSYYGSYPAELIERVEVIRGPGSAVYGQFAGTTVINMHTRSADSLEGGRFVLRATTLGGGDNGGGAYLTASGQFASGVGIAISAGFQADPFSRQPYVDTLVTGASFPQEKGNTRSRSHYFSGEVRALGAQVFLLRNALAYTGQVDGGGTGPLDPTIPGVPTGTIGALSRVVQSVRVLRSFELAKDLFLDGTMESIENTGGSLYPQSVFSGGVNHSGTERTRFGADLALRWVPTSMPATLLLGGGIYQDSERSVDLQNRGGFHQPSDPTQRFPQKNTMNRYGYLQYTQQLAEVGLTAGARYEDSELGSAFAPRLGLTYLSGPFNAKLLYGKAFRAPTIFQTYSIFFTFKGYLKPELIQSLELELGWRFSPNIHGKVNLYRMAVTQAISSALDSGFNYYIFNGGSMHSKGVEASLDVRAGDWGGFANLSYTKPDGQVDPFFMSGDRKDFLGLIPLKVNLGAFLRMGPVQVAPSLMYASSRQTQTARSAQSGLAPNSLMPALVESETVPARVLLNLSVTWKQVAGTSMELRLVGNNLTNANFPILQPYFGSHAPLPANDRRFTADFIWRF
ncbi:MAG: TonB-dependent receptor [Holophaga sp.]|nr:TonB-dependent receptor [Holophaga sp.]